MRRSEVSDLHQPVRVRAQESSGDPNFKALAALGSSDQEEYQREPFLTAEDLQEDREHPLHSQLFSTICTNTTLTAF